MLYVCVGVSEPRVFGTGNRLCNGSSELAAQKAEFGKRPAQCIYYGTEQEFDSGGRPSDSDVVLRENMFGGNFGGKSTRGHHFFDESGALYEALSQLVDLRKHLLPLRRGRQMLHEISGDGINFGLPHMMGDRMLSIVS